MMKKWLITMRIWSLTATVVPIALGGVLAWQSEAFSWGLFALILLCGALLQIATNLFNTYGDVKSGVDKDKMALLLLPLPVIHRAAWIVFVLALVLAGWIVVHTTYALLWFALAGSFGAACYTGKFFKYAGLGVPGVFFHGIFGSFHLQLDHAFGSVERNTGKAHRGFDLFGGKIGKLLLSVVHGLFSCGWGRTGSIHPVMAKCCCAQTLI